MAGLACSAELRASALLAAAALAIAVLSPPAAAVPLDLSPPSPPPGSHECMNRLTCGGCLVSRARGWPPPIIMPLASGREALAALCVGRDAARRTGSSACVGRAGMCLRYSPPRLARGFHASHTRAGCTLSPAPLPQHDRAGTRGRPAARVSRRQEPSKSCCNPEAAIRCQSQPLCPKRDTHAARGFCNGVRSSSGRRKINTCEC